MVTAAPPDILIVYNARSGAFAALADALHKIVSPETYPCSLCAVTYGPVAMRGEWRRFLATLPNAKRFFHTDDLAAAFPGIDVPPPAILTQHGEEAPRELVKAAELDAAADLPELIALVERRLAAA